MCYNRSKIYALVGYIEMDHLNILSIHPLYILEILNGRLGVRVGFDNSIQFGDF
jgi:hypothetical protein